MKPFPGWRAAGRAMQWARQQDGVTVERDRDGAWVSRRWRSGDPADHVELGGAGSLAHSLTIDLADGRYIESAHLPAVEVLRVLAALGLIPDELAQVRDERYARCVTCNGVLYWRAGRHGLPDRWGHLDRRAYLDGGTHRAEVA